MKGETLVGLNTIRGMSNPAQFIAMGGGIPASAPPDWPRDAGPVARHLFINPNEAALLHWMTRHFQAAQRPLRERAATQKKLEGEVEARMKGKSPALLVSGIMLTSYSGASEGAARQEAHHAVLLAACDVLAHRDRTGQWPKSLRDATANPPSDPFSGQPVSYRREKNGFVVYSVGASGAFAAKPGQPEKGESVFRYPRPPAP